MSDQFKMLDLIADKAVKTMELKTLLHGSIEIRESKGKKYIYIHYEDEGIRLTKYLGEYSDELYNLIINNNLKAKELKKDIRYYDKELAKLNYIDDELPMNVAVNIDFAKKYMVDTIYNQAILEDVATTLSDTQSIIEGGKIKNMTVEDTMKIINLKHAWEFIINKDIIQSETNFSLLCSINKLIEEGFYYSAGQLRTVPVKIGGTKWLPDIPFKSDIIDNINEILNLKTNDVDKAIKLLLFVVKMQMFLDGNKRTSLIFANHYLISKGLGMIVIPAEYADDYKQLLIEYYETTNDKNIVKFLKEKCYIKI